MGNNNQARRMNRGDFHLCATHMEENRQEFEGGNRAYAARLLGQFIGKPVSQGTVSELCSVVGIDLRCGKRQTAGPGATREVAQVVVWLCKQLGVEPDGTCPTTLNRLSEIARGLARGTLTDTE